MLHPEDEQPTHWNSKTLGGLQFWTDYRLAADFRLQQNELTRHWRTLDPRKQRRAWGTRVACESVFDELIAPHLPLGGYQRVIILLHGLMRTARSMRSLASSLQGQGLASSPKAAVLSPTYASTRNSIAIHAAALRCLVESLPGKPTIDWVGHSMGNIVIRHLIADLQRDGDPAEVLPRCHRMVMLGPPNQGAMIAKRLAATGLFGLLVGQGGLELGPQWENLRSRLATPPFPFAIVAGKISAAAGNHPLLEGESDLVVRVEETHLDGAARELEVPVLHSFLMDEPEVQRFIVQFIDEP